ncbi:hypothetical protein ACHGLA_00560 [Streptomyces sp. YH02]|uniref:hypothetical protein n=1 Tax=Streptomyces sp. YH02 TaxID=3256999 RepID=UPI0037578735
MDLRDRAMESGSQALQAAVEAAVGVEVRDVAGEPALLGHHGAVEADQRVVHGTEAFVGQAVHTDSGRFLLRSGQREQEGEDTLVASVRDEAGGDHGHAWHGFLELDCRWCGRVEGELAQLGIPAGFCAHLQNIGAVAEFGEQENADVSGLVQR